MKKNFTKRIISLFLAAIILFLMPSTAFAANDKGDIAATVTYFCYVKNPGHCWIYVENLTDEAFMVGAYKLEPDCGVSVGTFGFTRYDGWGIYYNVEAYAQNVHGLGSYSTITEELTKEEVKTLSNQILAHNNSWNIFSNCTAFAAKIWNSVSDKKMAALVFPAFVRVLMILRGARTNTPVMKAVTKDQVFKQKGKGSNAYLVNVRESSLGEIT